MITVMVTQGIFRIILVVGTICFINPWLLIGGVFGGIILYFYKRAGSPCMVDAQRMDSINRGPIHSTFGMVIQGLVTLRAFDKLGYFK